MDRVTLNDVALRARVSLATVSRALNQPALVRDSTVRRVREAAADLNFRPNLVGRNLRARTTRTLGVVLPTLTNTVFADCFQGIERATRLQHYSVMLTTTEYRVEDELAVTEELLRHRVDGLILTVASAAESPVLDMLDCEKMPYVLVYNQSPRPHRQTVSVDNRIAARDAVGHLISIGHRSIRMVTGDFRESDRAQLRYRGYRDAMRAAGLVPQPPVEVPLHTAVASGALAQCLRGRDPASALFCSNDLLAISVVSGLLRLGLHVPDDMSVVGFDGVDLGALLYPALATVVKPSRDIGESAVDTLLARLRGDVPGRSIVLGHSLRIGETAVRFARRPTSQVIRSPNRRK
ncbi:MAG: LacI family DNA-binding transcriptional regulator [Betaproteobacteria bacterium]|nr:LacI family DNA-binding transcriptional regulator [Betaproteobacteria bacterium]